MKKLFYLMVMAIIFGNPFSLWAESLKLDQLQSIARENNFKLQANKFDVMKFEMLEGKSKSGFYPQLGIDGELSKDSTSGESETETLGSIWGRYNLFNGFQDKKAVEISEIETEISRSKKREEEFKTLLKIEHLYYEYLFFQKRHEVAKKTLQRNRAHIELIRKRLASGLVTQTDLLEFQLLGSKLKSHLNFLSLKLIEKKEHLIGHIGSDQLTELKLSEELPHMLLESQLDDVLSTYRKNSEELKRGKLALQGTTLRRDSVKAGWMPKIDLEARYGYISEEETGFEDANATTSIGITASWELFSGNATHYQGKAIEYEKMAQGLLSKQKTRHALTTLRVHFQELQNLQQRIELEEKNEKIAKNLYRRTLKEYQRGVKDSGALASVSEELSQIEEQIYEFKHKFIEVKLEVEKLSGARLKTRLLEH